MDNDYKHLYIIGNGFDIFTGLKTSYWDFRKWLENSYIFVYEAMTSVYGADGEWWNDFEEQLGRLDFVKYVEKYPSKEKKLSESPEESHDTEKPLKTGDGLPCFNEDSLAANRLKGLLDILQYCFEKWVQYELDCHRARKQTYIEKENSFFINFNYTDTLERFYNIPEERVLHIHGRASKHERLIFGHDRSCLSYNTNNNDEREIAKFLSQYEKNPYYYISKYKILEKIKYIEHIHVLGFSFSDIDISYVDWIADNTSQSCDWEVSWLTKKDQNRINNFLSIKPQLENRLKLIKINEI